MLISETACYHTFGIFEDLCTESISRNSKHCIRMYHFYLIDCISTIVGYLPSLSMISRFTNYTDNSTCNTVVVIVPVSTENCTGFNWEV